MYLVTASVPRSSCFFFFSSRRRHTRFDCDWSSDVCSSDLGVLDDVGDVGSADAGGGFEEVEAAVRVGADELGVSDPVVQAQAAKGCGVDVEEFAGFVAGAIESACGEDAAGVHGVEGRLAVLVRRGEDDTAVPGDAFDVEDVAGDEALDEVVGGGIAETVEMWPDVVGIGELLYAD